MGELFGFVFPDERIYWQIPIVIYPFLTCIATGTFFLSTLDHLFKNKALKPVSNFALLASMAFVCFASLPLLVHLGHPERAFNIMFTPSIRSAMATFGYIYGFYLGLVFLEVWFVFRPQIVESALARKGVKRAFYSIFALGVREVTPGASRIDHAIVKLIAFLRVPTACVLSGYVGLIFGTLDAVPMWSWRLMPVIFLLSAVAGGIGLITVLYGVAVKVKGWKLDARCVRSMAAYLLAFLLLTGLVQFINFLRSNYGDNPDWQFSFQTLKSESGFSFIGLQLIVGWVAPVVLLLALLLIKMKDGLRSALAVTSSVLAVVHLFTFLWNLVIGGQLASRTLRGALSFQPEFVGKEGILVSAVIVICPLVLFFILTKLLPPFTVKAPEVHCMGGARHWQAVGPARQD